MAVNLKYEMAIAAVRALSADERREQAQEFAEYVAERHPKMLREMRDATGKLFNALGHAAQK